ncbi:MAG: hypothetical protein DRN17_03620 [Thermoplasmata archaeon]|nr:MAG: hypothetical protein DRN17_03620 [Thermoplasmata archaeon]
MKLSKKRCKFTHMASLLVLYIEQMGYHAAYDDVMRKKTCSHGHPNSTHRSGLAVDMVIYDSDWNYLSHGLIYAIAHDFWDQIGGARRIEKDLGHFSLPWKGVR